MNRLTGQARRNINSFVERHELELDLTMGVLALVFMVIGLFQDHPLGPLSEETLLPIEIAITVIFIVEFGLRFFGAESRLAYAKSHWIDLLALLPAIRFFRVLRLGRLVYVLRAARFLRLGVFVRFLAEAERVANRITWIASRNGVHVALIAALGLIVIGGSIVWELEHTTNRFFYSFGDALWWAVSTVATVGYGEGPATLLGRLVAVVLMVIGISCFGLITATVTTLFIDRVRDPGVSNADLLAAIRELQVRLDHLERDKQISKE